MAGGVVNFYLVDIAVHDLGGLIASAKIKVGDYIQAESLSPTLAGENVQSGLKALAIEGQEIMRQRVAEAATAAAAAVAATSPADVTAVVDEQASEGSGGVLLARSSSRARTSATKFAYVNDLGGYNGATDFSACGGLLFSCLGRSSHWYQQNEMAPNFEADAFADAFPGKPLGGFLANGEIFGEKIISMPSGGSGEAPSGQDDGSSFTFGFGDNTEQEASVPTTPAVASPSQASNSEDATGDSGSGPDYATLTVRQLKQALTAASIDFRDCVEKSDLVARCAQIPLEAGNGNSNSDDDNGEDEEDEMDFMHGFTAVYAVSGATQSTTFN
eukprot:COSAG05_NODE_2093_length_3574_cov_5.267338_2_plen_330_part_00